MDEFEDLVSRDTSPIEIVSELPGSDAKLLRYGRYDLSHPPVFGSIDTEDPLDGELIRRATRELKFSPLNCISQEWNYLQGDSLKAYRDLRDFLETQEIPYFITVADEGPRTMFVGGGYNPNGNLRMDNERSDIFQI